MRGLARVAALLSPAWASGFVIPNAIGIDSTSGPIIDYHSSDATVTFAVHGVNAGKALEFHVTGVDQACGQSDIDIDGQRLETVWQGVEGHGHAFLDGLSENEAVWSVACLYDTVPSDGSFSNGRDVIHLLRLGFRGTKQQKVLGFTISYKQLSRPGIIRFTPHVVEYDKLDDVAALWRTPSTDFESQPAEEISSVEDAASTASSASVQKSLSLQSIQQSVAEFSSLLKEKINSAVGKLVLCKQHVLSKPAEAPLDLVLYQNQTRNLGDKNDDGDQSNELTTPTTDTADITSVTHSLGAAETRSLTLAEEDPSSITASPHSKTSTSFSSSETNYAPLKSFGITILLFTILVWVYLRFMDPRRRVDRATRREERRNKRLYKRAARKHALKSWFQNFRLKYKLVSSDALRWNEKRSRVVEQESVLDSITDDDIRAIRRAHWAVRGITAAEEGRIGLEYEPEGSERRRSVSTLPGYESDGSRPPSYDEASRAFSGPTLADGTIFTPGYTYSNPASSVVSTSPRLSRDGTNSDFEEKIEALSLEQSAAIDSPRVYRSLMM